MKKNVPYSVLIGICLFFFYKTILFGKIPFPGDLLLAQYSPWNHESYEGYVAGSVPTKNQYFDVIRELYPWKTLVIDQVKHGIFPLWNPYNFSGAPLLANYQSQVFYPLTFLYFLLPQVTAWTIMVVIQPILGSIFLYLFATEIGISTAGALLTAILFNFSSFANVWMEFTTVWHTILWLPLLLYLIERSVKQKSLTIGQQIIFIFALFSAITGGHPQDFINSFLFLSVYILVRRAPKSIFFPLIAPFFIAAPQIFPTIELFRHSARVAHDYQGIIHTMLVQWWQLPLIAVSDFFGNPATKSNITGDYVGKTLSIGMAGFLLAVTAFWNSSKSWHKKFFMGTAFFILLLTVRSPVSELLYRYPWPILSTGTPTRILFLLLFAFAILAGFGFDAIKDGSKIPTQALVIVWIAFVLLSPFAPLKRAMILPGVVLMAATVIVGIAKNKKIFLLAFIPLAVLELFYTFIKFNPFVPGVFVYPSNKLIETLKPLTGINRFWGYGTAGIEANFATQLGLYSPDGTDPLNLAWYNRFLQSGNDGNIALTFNRTTRSDARLAPGYGKSDLPNNEFRLRLMDALGVKYILDRSENPKDDTTFPTTRFKLLTHVDDWTMYENLRAAPRFFVTSDIRPYTDTKDFQNQFFGKDFFPDKTVLLSQTDYDSLSKFSEGTGAATLIGYSPSSVIIGTSAQFPEFLFLSDTFDNGWMATINGKSAKIYRANFTFRGVVVPQGDSTVVFTYRPKSFQTGLAVGSFTLFITAVYFIYTYKTRKQQ